MRVEVQILLFILILNISTAIVVQLGEINVIAGTTYSNPGNYSGTSEEYQQRFNASEITDPDTGWSPPTSTIPIIGDVFGGFAWLIKQVGFLFAGFPLELYALGQTYITDSTGLLVWSIITGALSAIFGIYMSLFIIQFISGRVLND